MAFLFCALASAQSITSPASSATWSGYNGNTYQISGAPSGSAWACYTLDSYPATNAGDPSGWGTNTGAQLFTACVPPPFSMPNNTYWTTNGPRHLLVTFYDAKGSSLGTATQDYTIANAWPCSTVPVLTVSTSTSLTSN